LRVSRSVAPSLTRGWICNLLVQFAIIRQSKSRRTHDHILLSHLSSTPPILEGKGPVFIRLGRYSSLADSGHGVFFCTYKGASGRVVGWGTLLLGGRSLVRFQMRSLDSSTDLSFQQHYGSGVDWLTNRHEYHFLKGKGRPTLSLTSPSSVSRLSRKCGFLDIWQPYSFTAREIRMCHEKVLFGKHQGPPRCWYLSTELHGVTNQKTQSLPQKRCN
jgi:hypothetical protein